MPSTQASSPSHSDDALASYMAVTNTQNIAAARAALQTANGDLDLAITTYFDSGPASSSHQQPTTTSYARFNIDDSSQSLSNRSISPIGRGARRAYEDASPRRPSKWFMLILRIWSGPLRFLSFPVSIVADLTLTVFGILGRLVGLRLPSISFHWPRGRPSRPTDPRTCAERWVRELEEETGAESSYNSQTPSSSSSSRRSARRLPDFLPMGYDKAVKKAKEDLKVLMVVLVSEEHDDVAQFKRTTLMDAELLRSIQNNNILVWGGDVRDRDACLAAQILDVTTYPTICFISLQTKRPPIGTAYNRANSSAQPVMTISCRLEGLSATSSASVINTITGTVIPRTSPLLMRLRADRDRRAAERQLREEQDRAYAEAGRRDRQRVEAKKAELAEKARRAEEEASRLRTVIEKREQRALDEGARTRWRTWAAREKMPVEPVEGTARVVTIGFRLGNGRRVVRRFMANEPIESLYVFVEVESAGGIEAIMAVSDGKPVSRGYKHDYRFKLSTAMPRRIIPLDIGKENLTIEEFGGLDGANVNVEGNVGGNGPGSDDDEDEDEDQE